MHEDLINEFKIMVALAKRQKIQVLDSRLAVCATIAGALSFGVAWSALISHRVDGITAGVAVVVMFVSAVGAFIGLYAFMHRDR